MVDVWDALLSDRSYSKAWPREDVVRHIEENAGKLFDPEIAEEFLRLVNKNTFTTSKKTGN